VVRSNWSCGFVDERSGWKKGHRRDIPPMARSAERTACFTPKRESEYESWSPPGPLPTMTTG